MPATFKITLSHKPNAEGLYPVWLRITAARVVRYAPVGLELLEKQWNPAGKLDKENWIKSSHRQAGQLNDDLVQVLREAKALSKQHPDASADELKQLFLTRHAPRPLPPAESADFVAFMRSSLEQVDAQDFTQATYESRQAVVSKFSAFAPTLPFSELTEEFIGTYEKHLKALGNGPGTRKKNLDILHIYVKRAIKKKLLSRDADPLEDYERPTPTPDRVWLTDAELQAYESAPLPHMQHLARLTYLMGFYLHGSRVGAVLRLKWKDRAFGRVEFEMDKGGLKKSVEESPQLAALLDSLRPAEGSAPDPEAYILPWLRPHYERMLPRAQLQEMKRATSQLNMNIKRGATKCGIGKKLSSHVARRTLATEADRANEGDLGKVGGLLGHRQRRTTEIYIDKYNSAEVDAAARKTYTKRQMPQTKATG